MLFSNLTSVVLPSKKKYVAKSPAPSSDWKIISLSSVLFLIYKSPVSLVINEFDPLWKILKSPLLPNWPFTLSWCSEFSKNNVLFAEPSILTNSVLPDWNLISPSSLLFLIIKSPVMVVKNVSVPSWKNLPSVEPPTSILTLSCALKFWLNIVALAPPSNLKNCVLPDKILISPFNNWFLIIESVPSW